MARRVAITGLGSVSPFGIGIETFRASLKSGRVATSQIKNVDVDDFPYVNGGEVRDFNAREHVQTLEPDDWGRSGLMAAASARLAILDSRVTASTLENSNAGAIYGTTNAESSTIDQFARTWVDSGLDQISQRDARAIAPGNVSSAVAQELALDGEHLTIATACSASNYAIGYAFDRIALGEATLMLAGGADSFNRWGHAGFYRLGALARESCRPFDADRDGMLTSEGAVSLLLEDFDAAVQRGANIYAEVLGYGITCDASHPVAPDADSIAECMRAAHRSAGITPTDVDYICAHGTGTPTNDRTEVAAARQVFGNRLPPMSSVKSMIGHTMGAASGFGAAACCLALKEGFLPPTAGVTTVDPKLGEDFDPVPGQSRPSRIRIAQNNGFAFGGNNAITVFGAVE